VFSIGVFTVTGFTLLFFQNSLILRTGSEPIYLSYLFSTVFILRIIFYVAVALLLYIIGYSLKLLFSFRYTSAGVVSFFILTYLLNQSFVLMGISHNLVENMSLLVVVVLSLAYLIYNYRHNKKIILLLIGGVCLIVLVLLLTPASVFVQRRAFADEVTFWQFKSDLYYNQSLLAALKHPRLPGYGQLVPHVWVTIRRIINPLNDSVSFFTIPGLLIFIFSFFLLELDFTKKYVSFICFLFILNIFRDHWLFFLLSNSLYGEGVAALFFIIYYYEASYWKKQFDNESCKKRQYLFWVFFGTLFLTKPFTSGLIFLVPILLFSGYIISKNKKALTVVFIYALMVIGPLLWYIVQKHLGLCGPEYGTKALLSGVNLKLLPLILKNWKGFTSVFYLLFFGGAILGLNARNRSKVIRLLFIVIVNLIIIFVYALQDKFCYGAAFRHFAQTYYLLLLAFSYGFIEIIDNVFSKRSKKVNSMR